MLWQRVWPARPTFEGSASDFAQIRREILRLLDSTAGDGTSEAAANVFPPMNITQDDDNFYIRAEVPGIKPAEKPRYLHCETVSRFRASGKFRASANG